jgi:L-threonylcarbamoyladenylate synthase
MKIKDAELINIDENLSFAVGKAEKMYLEGTVFIYPTDTIYGFGANPFNEEAVTRINEIKGRDAGKMYILLIDSIENLLKYIDVESEKHIDFLLSIWPNPVSVVLKLNEKTSSLLGHETAAFRIPNHRFCLKLLQKLKMPLISTSVNRSTHPPLMEQTLIKDEFASEVDAIFYTEKKSYYEASTIIDLVDANPRLLREGKIKFEDLLGKFN